MRTDRPPWVATEALSRIPNSRAPRCGMASTMGSQPCGANGTERTVRIVLIPVFLAVAACCAFGFAATFEPLERGQQIAWRIVHGAGVLLSLIGAAWTLTRARGREDPDRGER